MSRVKLGVACLWLVVLAAIAGFRVGRAMNFSAAEVSRSYKCGVMRALRDRDHMGPTNKQTEALCTRLQQADWTTADKSVHACLAAAGWGNYLSANRKQEDQERCIPGLR